MIYEDIDKNESQDIQILSKEIHFFVHIHISHAVIWLR